jgi:hypothetical protein
MRRFSRNEKLVRSKAIVARFVVRAHAYAHWAAKNAEISAYLKEKRFERIMKKVVKRFLAFVMMRRDRKHFLHLRNSAIAIQRRVRCWFAHRSIARLKWACMTVQRVVRRIQARKKVMKVRKSIRFMEGVFFAWLTRKRFLQILHATKELQRWTRSIVLRRVFRRKREAVLRIQRFYRGILSLRKFQDIVTMSMMEAEVASDRSRENAVLKRLLHSQNSRVGIFEVDVMSNLDDMCGISEASRRERKQAPAFIQSVVEQVSDWSHGRVLVYSKERELKIQEKKKQLEDSMFAEKKKKNKLMKTTKAQRKRYQEREESEQKENVASRKVEKDASFIARSKRMLKKQRSMQGNSEVRETKTSRQRRDAKNQATAVKAKTSSFFLRGRLEKEQGMRLNR